MLVERSVLIDKDEDGRLNHEELQMALADLGGATMTPTSQQEALRCVACSATTT